MRHLVTTDDIGTHVTIAVRGASNRHLYVSGVVRDVTDRTVTIGRMVHPTGPWDRFESHEEPTTIEHRRIMRRA